jgi:hypothetical protein
MKDKKLTTASGRPYFENEDSRPAGSKSPISVINYGYRQYQKVLALNVALGLGIKYIPGKSKKD